jgi:hypothetical protein
MARPLVPPPYLGLVGQSVHNPRVVCSTASTAPKGLMKPFQALRRNADDVLSQYGHLWWYRHVCAIGGVFNVLMMMTANLIGFVVGVDGIKYLGSQLVDSWNGVLLPATSKTELLILISLCTRFSLHACGMHLLICRRSSYV